MVRDVNLKLLDAATPITTSTNQTAKDTEGGFRADVRLYIGTITDADETLALHLDASTDGGSTYFQIASFPGIVATDDGLEIARAAYVPYPDPGQTVTKVRTRSVVAGTTPSFPITAYLEPLVSLAVPATDETGVATGTNGRRGLACLT